MKIRYNCHVRRHGDATKSMTGVYNVIDNKRCFSTLRSHKQYYTLKIIGIHGRYGLTYEFDAKFMPNWTDDERAEFVRLLIERANDWSKTSY